MFIVHSTAKYGVTYTLEWDKVLKMQRWAAYSITDLNAVANWNRKNWEGATWQGVTYNGDPFQEDPILPAQYRTHLSDYRSSGFTRGHIVNSQDRLMSQNANGQTYYLSNIQPQIYDFNAGIWLNMENWVHRLGFNKTKRKALYIAKGGLFCAWTTTISIMPLLSGPSTRRMLPRISRTTPSALMSWKPERALTSSRTCLTIPKLWWRQAGI